MVHYNQPPMSPKSPEHWSSEQFAHAFMPPEAPQQHFWVAASGAPNETAVMDQHGFIWMPWVAAADPSLSWNEHSQAGAGYYELEAQGIVSIAAGESLWGIEAAEPDPEVTPEPVYEKKLWPALPVKGAMSLKGELEGQDVDDVAEPMAEYTGRRGSRQRRHRPRRSTHEFVAPQDINASADVPTEGQLIVSEAHKEELMKGLEAGGDLRISAISKIQGKVVAMALEPHGCRVVQKALEVAAMADKEALVSELRGHVIRLISSKHGNYVIQKAIQGSPPSWVSFVAGELKYHAVEFARDRFGCRVLCRLSEHAQADELVEELLPHMDSLIKHNFARHVVELLLEHGSQRHRDAVVAAIRKNLLANSKHRNASYVIECAFVYCSDAQRTAMATELMADVASFIALAIHECGCHVISAILTSQGQITTDAREVLLACYEQVGVSKYGQRLLEEFQQ